MLWEQERLQVPGLPPPGWGQGPGSPPPGLGLVPLGRGQELLLREPEQRLVLVLVLVPGFRGREPPLPEPVLQEQ